MKILSKTATIIIDIILVVLLLICGTLAFQKIVLQKKDARIFGYGQAVVVSGSMVPTIQIDDMILYKNTDWEDYQVGDIVLYERDQDLIVHRVIEKGADYVVTQGDANNIDDGEISRDRVVGRVVKIIPRAGVVAEWMQSSRGLFTLLAICLLCYAVPWLVGRHRHKED